MGPSSPVSPSSNSTPALTGTGNSAVSAAASAGTGSSANLVGGFLGNSPYGTANTSLLGNASGYHTNTSPRPPSANGLGGALGGQIHPVMSAATPTSIGSTPYSHMHSMSHLNPSSGFSSQYCNMTGSTAADIASPHYHDMRGSTAATGWYTSPHTDPRFASEYCKYLNMLPTTK